MEAEDVKETIIKEDADSGLDNTSDSCQSCDEEYEDIINSDTESNSSRESDPKRIKKISTTKQTETVSENLTLSDSKTIEKPSDSHKNIKDVRIEFNNIDEEYREAVDFFKTLTIGQNETVDFSINQETAKPEWLDEEKYKRGQKFARDHFFCINFAEMVSLFILFAEKASLGPLIFTGKSDSPYTAFCRYLGTVTKLISWYRDYPWGDDENSGKKNLSIVRGMHKSVYQRLTNTPVEELRKKTTLGNPDTTALWCPLRNLLVSDFKESLPEVSEEVQRYVGERKVWINQADMSITQFGFVGLAVTYPEYFGIYVDSEDELDAFVHMWRGLGYLLGIKDEYNYCNSDLETVRRRTKFFLETFAKPSFRQVTCDWEHMCRCLTSGIAFYVPQVDFESSLLYLCRVLNINTPRLSKNVSFRSYIVYQLHRFVFTITRYKNVLAWLNCKLGEIIKKAQNAPPELLSKWENKEFAYTKQEGKCPIRGEITSQNV